jgi:homocysteine S-methyltransferase
MDWHRPRLDILAMSGADLLACETIPTLVEAEALVRLLAEMTGVPAWLSFSCRDECRLHHGEPLAEAVALANESPAVIAVGVNCTPPCFVAGLLQRAAEVATRPLLAYPNSGERWDATRRMWDAPADDPLDWGAAALAWREAGARLIGGCCRTTPDTIRRIAAAVRAAPLLHVRGGWLLWEWF